MQQLVVLYIVLLQKLMCFIKQLPEGNDEESLLHGDTSLNFSKLEIAKRVKIITGAILCTQVTVSPNLIYLATSHPSFKMGTSITFSGKHPEPLHLHHFPNPVCDISFSTQQPAYTFTIKLIIPYSNIFYISTSIFKEYQVHNGCLLSG